MYLGWEQWYIAEMKVRTILNNTTMAIELVKAGGQNLDKRKTYK